MTYWSPRTPITKANLNGVASTFDIDSIGGGYIYASFENSSITVNGTDTEAVPSTILQIGSVDNPIQWNGHSWRIGVELNDATDFDASGGKTRYSTTYQIAVNGDLQASMIMNQGVGTLEFIFGADEAASLTPPIEPGGTMYVTFAIYIVDNTYSTTVRADSASSFFLFIEDLGKKTYADEVRASGPTLWYRLDESEASVAIDNTIHDSSGNGWHCTTFGAGTYALEQPSLVGGGTSAFSPPAAFGPITSDHNFNPAPSSYFTVEVVVKISQFDPAGGTFVSFDNFDAALRYEPGTTDLKLLASTNNATLTSYITAAYTMSTDIIYHLAGTFNGTQIILYVNGVAIDTVTVPAAVWKMSSTPSNFFVASAFSGNMIGFFDEAVYYNYALSANDIKRHYDAMATH